MTTEHTQGPWYAVPVHQEWVEVCDNDADHEREILASAIGENRAANARLIAAAPELLRACDEADTAFACLNISDGISHQARGALRDAWALVNSAIAKATGRPDRFAEANPDVSAAAIAKAEGR